MIKIGPAYGSPFKDFDIEVAKGNVQGHSVGTIFGHNLDLDPSTPAMIWDYGPSLSLEIYPTADTEMFMSSTSAADTNVGILVFGMTDDYQYKTELHVHTTGQAQHSVGNWFRVFKMTVVSGVGELGDIYMAEADTLTLGVPDTPAKVHALVHQGTGTSHKASGTVPAGHTMFVNRVFFGVRRGEDCVFEFYVKPFGFPEFIEASNFPIYQAGMPFTPLDPPFPVTGKSDWELRGSTVTNNTQAIANVGYVLVEDGF